MYTEEQRKEILRQACEIAQADEMMLFIESVIVMLPIGKTTFYAWFPKDSEEYKQLETIVNSNKVKVKTQIRRKLGEGRKSGELLALYRMICSEEERKAIATNYTNTDVTSNGQTISIKVDAETADIIEQLKGK